MGVLQALCILAVLMHPIVLSRPTEDQIDCRGVQCQPLQCPGDSIAIYEEVQEDNYDAGIIDEDEIPGDEEEDENIQNVEHENKENISPQESHLEANEKGDEQENRTLSKRSLQYKRRESIKIVPGDYKSFIPDDGRYHGYNHNHHKWKRETALAANETTKTTNDTMTSSGIQCCPKQKCICSGECDIPSCPSAHVLTIVEDGDLDQPGKCCPVHKCLIEPDCKANVTNITWNLPCKSCRCVAGHKFCHDTCGEDKVTILTCLSAGLRRHYHDGESWNEDACTRCECHAGKPKCYSSACKPLECERKARLPGECCPVCVDDTSNVTMISTSTEQNNTTDPEVFVLSSTSISPPSQDNATPKVILSDPTVQTSSEDVGPSTLVPRNGSEHTVSLTDDNSTTILTGCAIVLLCAVVAASIWWCLFRNKKKKNVDYQPVSFDTNSNHVAPP
ncbi:unnamed protein product [Hermetia illucens]|uniref:VWFC domain-containing protein n=1 Tax=Hermetia illucens TaxID=343691 RepID=A0A7R8UHV0_HERIL|nr:uncharacterized protein LOC119647775 isoform X2 [Hermetia illucens]CAD7081163.1 unnamed protein product [Hermetia illucens]